jgi:hypothetical protein
MVQNFGEPWMHQVPDEQARIEDKNKKAGLWALGAGIVTHTLTAVRFIPLIQICILYTAPAVSNPIRGRGVAV